MKLWVVVAIVAALLKTAYSVLQKHLTFDYDGLELSYATSVLGGAFLLPVGAWFIAVGDVRLTPPVAGAILLSAVVNIGAIWAFLAALKLADLSVVAPLKQSTPVLVALVEPLVLVADYQAGVLLGAVAAVVGGAILLRNDGGMSATRTSGTTRRAAGLAVTAAALFAIASLANRFVTTRISPYLYAFLIYALMALGFSLLVRATDRRLGPNELRQPRLLLLGGVTALRTTVAYVAFSLAIASRVSIVLQTSILLNVLAGGVLFAESDLRRKIVGAALIVVGVVLAI